MNPFGKLTKEHIYWAVTMVVLTGFFATFWHIKPKNTTNPEIKLSIETTPNSLGNGFPDDGKEVLIKLTAENTGSDVFSHDDYFFKVLSNRSYAYSMGIILKDFSKQLPPQGNFELEFTAEDLFLQRDSKKFFLYFNMYKRNGGKDPILISSAQKIMWVK